MPERKAQHQGTAPKPTKCPACAGKAPTLTVPPGSGYCTRRGLRMGRAGRGGLACCLGVLFSSAAGSTYWPIAICCPSLGPFPSIVGGAHRPLTSPYPSSLSLPYLPYFPFLSLGRLCQRSPWFHCSVRGFLVSLLCVGSTQRRATALAVGQVCPSSHPKSAVWDPSPTAAFGPWDVHLRGLFPVGGTKQPSASSFPCLWRGGGGGYGPQTQEDRGSDPRNRTNLKGRHHHRNVAQQQREQSYRSLVNTHTKPYYHLRAQRLNTLVSSHMQVGTAGGAVIKKKKKTRSVQYALHWRLVGNRWQLVGNRWRLVGNRWRLVGN